MMRNGRISRLWARLGFFSTAIVLLWPLPYMRDFSEIPVQASPFVVAGTILAEKSLRSGMILGLFFFAVAIVRKRWFCRYVCPTGLLLDGAIRIGVRKNALWKRFPSIGKYIVYLTLAGAVIGYPLFLWMDPLAIFSSAVSVRNSESFLAGALAITCLVILLTIALVFGDLWCARICPLGALQDLTSKVKSVSGFWKKEEETESGKEKKIQTIVSGTRRAFLSLVAGIGLGLWAKKAGSARREGAPLRPPGASGEEAFAGLCLRCGNCIRTCPSRIIHTDTGQAGFSGLLAPVVQFKDKYCLEDCHACTQVCPSGALQDISLVLKNRYKIGEALVDGSLCYMVQGISDCDICVRSCPFKAIEVYWDEDLYVAYPNIDPGKCNGCGACEVYCPTPEVKAIRIWKLEDNIR